MNRRALLKLAPAALVVGAVPAVAVEETPVMRMFREWTALWAEAERLCDGVWKETEAEHEAVTGRMVELETQMVAAPKSSLLEIMMAVTAATNFGVVSYEDSFFLPTIAEARALVA